MGLASIVQRAARLFGYQVINPQRLGIDLQNDIIRLSAQEPVRVVLDVGGNVGQTACEYTSYFPQAQIYTFEPVPASFAKLQSAVANLPRVKAFQMAVGSSTGTVFMNVGDDSQLNSIVKVKDSTSVIEVPLDSLDHIVSSLSLDQIDLLKIDVEGFELEVLKGAVRLFAEKKVRFLVIECILQPNAEMPHTDFLDVLEVLNKAGFCCVTLYSQYFNLRLGSTVVNALFALKERLPAKVPGTLKNIA